MNKNRGCALSEYGMLATRAGLPIAARVSPGNTADPTVSIPIAPEIHALSGSLAWPWSGDRGMIPNARVEDLKKDTHFGWVTALRNTDIQQLADGEGPLQMSLFDEQNLAEISPQIPRRTSHRLQQPRPGRQTRPQAHRPARGHRGQARDRQESRGREPTQRRRKDRREGRKNRREIQLAKALRHHQPSRGIR
ncbi:hypothetical protein ACIPUB_01930 [Paeniglutamicibacter sp. ORCA_105]|uniref:hypothetical protein n=1 Tax=Paeniglutamicibacter sp. ORCA_105 TaxID=3377336 RepID=UPI003894F3C0